MRTKALHIAPPPLFQIPDGCRAVRIRLAGVVQGVGFRPFVFRLAQDLGLRGWVQNCGAYVEITAEGEGAALQSLLQGVISDAPPLARPYLLDLVPKNNLAGYADFQIKHSALTRAPDVHLPLDSHACDACLHELSDPNNRRYRYPFINCTQCGPRYTLIDALPYDRQRTSMADFPLCAACRAEYENPQDRRFHAEPIACPDCGPQLAWISDAVSHQGEAALSAAVQALREGKIIAVRGVGGYHLMVDATNAVAVARLRERKQRPSRPFALLVNEVFAAKIASADELALLKTAQRPIVLIDIDQPMALAEGIAPGLRQLGIMLPYSPLHHLLLADFGGALVATSGNLAGEPIAIEPADAEARLGRIADGFLHHNRPILRPVEDSVWQVYAQHGAVPLRLGRGSAPLEFELAQPLPVPMLALGGEQKVTLALGWGRRVVVSPHLGDLAHPQSLALLQTVAADFCRIYQVEAKHLVIDAHPAFQSRQWTQAQGLPISEVWHHHAHASALAVEHPHITDWLILAWDGVGLGVDGGLWGGEVLRGRPGAWRRVVSLRPFRLPGGEAASSEIWRSAAGLLWEAGEVAPQWHAQQALLQSAWQRGLNSPHTTAVGRLFDAAAALMGVCHNTSYEGEGPMRVQALAQSTAQAASWPVCWQQEGDLLQLDWQPWLALLQDECVPQAERARSFHMALAQTVAALPVLLGVEKTMQLGLTGGVFQNRLLVDLIDAAMPDYPIYLPQHNPPNDGGLALGQLVEAGALYAS